MALLERVQVLLAHGPLGPWAAVDLPGAVHRQPGRFVVHDQPLDPIHIRLALAEVVRVALEDRLHVRLVALQEEGPGADGRLGFLQVAVFLHHFRGDDPHAHRVGQHVEQPDEGLFEEELHRIAVHHLHPVHGLQQLAVGIALFRQEAVEGEFDILGHQLAAVDGRLVVPFDPLAQMEDIGRVVRLFPAFGQIGLDDEGARRHVRADFMPHELAVDEAQRVCVLKLSVRCGSKCGGIPAAHAQDAAALGLPRFRPPERRGTIQGPGGQGDTGGEARFQQIAAAQTQDILARDMPAALS